MGKDPTQPPKWGNEVRLTDASFDLERAGVWAGQGFFLGDYMGLAAAGNSFDAFFSMTNGSDPGDIYFRDPAADGGTPAPAAANDAPAPVLSAGEATGGASANWARASDLLAASLAFASLDPAVMPTPAAVTPATSAPHSASGAGDSGVSPPAWAPGTPSAAPALWGGHESADDGGADALTSADPSSDGEAA